MRAADVSMYEAKTTGVSHRIADTIEVNESLLAEAQTGDVVADPEFDEEAFDEDGLPLPVVSDGYIGVDRRRSPVPPPPQMHDGLLPPPESVETPSARES